MENKKQIYIFMNTIISLKERIFLIIPFIALALWQLNPHLCATIIFASSIVAIAVEKKTGFDKFIPSIIAFGCLWLGISLFNPELLKSINITLNHHQTEPVDVIMFMLKNSVTIVIFLLAAMIIVDYANTKYAFGSIINKLRENKYLSGLIIVSMPIIFFMSMLFDNMTTALIFASITSPLLSGNLRVQYLGLVIIAANAGGLTSILGDPPTTFMYLKDKIGEGPTFIYGILPAATAVFVPAFMLYKKVKIKKVELKWTNESSETNNTLLFMVIVSLLIVPLLKYFLHVEPFLSISFAAGFVMLYAIWNKDGKTVEHVLHSIDWMGLGYFLTILGAVGALETLGTVSIMGDGIQIFMKGLEYIGIDHIYAFVFIAFLLGIISAYVDNIPIVVLCVAIFAITPKDDSTWHLLNYFLNTGGSLTIIGSAAGVMLMNKYNIDFINYKKLVFKPAFYGYIAGGVIALAQQLILNGLV
jgi:Na+/H+ antiporter NhaD/arsenite permease-like protein